MPHGAVADPAGDRSGLGGGRRGTISCEGAPQQGQFFEAERLPGRARFMLDLLQGALAVLALALRHMEYPIRCY